MYTLFYIDKYNLIYITYILYINSMIDMCELKETPIDNLIENNDKPEVIDKPVSADIIHQDKEVIADTINDYFTKFRIDEIKKDPEMIRKMDNPAEEFQLAAVEQDFKVIQYIHNPSKKTKLFVAKQI